jgi:hypothetical protein
MTDTDTPSGRSSRRSVSLSPLLGELRCRVRSEIRWRDIADAGADVDDPALRCAQQRKEALRDGDCADNIRLQLSAHDIDRNALQWRADGDARVVHDGPQSGVATQALNEFAGPSDGRCVGDVEHDRDELTRRR